VSVDGSAPQPTCPLFVWESGALYVFASVNDAELDLEAIDVRGGIYRAFDATGRLLRLEVERLRERFLWVFSLARERVRITLAEDASTHADELAGILEPFLEHLGLQREASTKMTLSELVAAATDALL
jgi:hypothetical protein